MKSRILVVLVPIGILAAVAALAIAFGGPSYPPPISSINNPFKNLDYSDMPAASHFVARDGTTLAFRAYPTTDGANQGSVVLVHGSSARSSSMHVLAKAFTAAAYTAYALDIRGTANPALGGTSPTSVSWKTTSKTLYVPSSLRSPQR